jgi:hypothetical protein
MHRCTPSRRAPSSHSPSSRARSSCMTHWRSAGLLLVTA